MCSSAPSTGPSTSGITTATFHIFTPYPGTQLYSEMAAQGRMTTSNWDLYDTRHVVYRPIGITPDRLKAGYDWAYRAFYEWGAICKAVVRASVAETLAQALRLQRGLEEVRAGVGLRDSPQAAVADAADARGSAVPGAVGGPDRTPRCHDRGGPPQPCRDGMGWPIRLSMRRRCASTRRPRSDRTRETRAGCRPGSTSASPRAALPSTASAQTP